MNPQVLRGLRRKRTPRASPRRHHTVHGRLRRALELDREPDSTAHGIQPEGRRRIRTAPGRHLEALSLAPSRLAPASRGLINRLQGGTSDACRDSRARSSFAAGEVTGCGGGGVGAGQCRGGGQDFRRLSLPGSEEMARSHARYRQAASSAPRRGSSTARMWLVRARLASATPRPRTSRPWLLLAKGPPNDAGRAVAAYLNRNSRRE